MSDASSDSDSEALSEEDEEDSLAPETMRHTSAEPSNAKQSATTKTAKTAIKQPVASSSRASSLLAMPMVNRENASPLLVSTKSDHRGTDDYEVDAKSVKSKPAAAKAKRVVVAVKDVKQTKPYLVPLLIFPASVCLVKL